MYHSYKHAKTQLTSLMLLVGLSEQFRKGQAKKTPCITIDVLDGDTTGVALSAVLLTRLDARITWHLIPAVMSIFALCKRRTKRI